MKALGIASCIRCLWRAYWPGAAQAEIKTQWVDYKEGDTALQGYLAYDDGIAGKRPGILLLHRRDGMSDLTLANAKMYAQQGYVVFAPDIFGKDMRPKTVPEMQAQTALYTNNRPLMRARAQAGFDVLRTNPMVDPIADRDRRLLLRRQGRHRICRDRRADRRLGGDPRLVPRLSRPKRRRTSTARCSSCTAPKIRWLRCSEVIALIDQLRAAKVAFELNLYSGTEHGFSTPKDADEERADNESKVAQRAVLQAGVRAVTPRSARELPDPPLLLVTDRRQARRPLPEIVAAALDAGCRWISLREKDLPEDEQVPLARLAVAAWPSPWRTADRCTARRRWPSLPASTASICRPAAIPPPRGRCSARKN